eukprot:CAMPEP_0168611498 /NCGR_PEP_ID=MMETSP0449_2-20121227/2393_1 /TAXON_ID=1082188 /ORGANISM="Strombidium rassoulzadegani, Strain ras09" /LENGTH=74 /DNA_ID=CAMNT_0008651955 /DNA_START=314 /DNA_END=538 /DNA_ORIENTATION=+
MTHEHEDGLGYTLVLTTLYLDQASLLQVLENELQSIDPRSPSHGLQAVATLEAELLGKIVISATRQESVLGLTE